MLHFQPCCSWFGAYVESFATVNVKYVTTTKEKVNFTHVSQAYKANKVQKSVVVFRDQSNKGKSFDVTESAQSMPQSSQAV